MNGIIEFHQVQCFVQQAVQLYRKCVNLLKANQDYELVLAARSDLVPRRSSFVDPETGSDIHCHIHGNGYTIEDRECQKVYRFSARKVNGESRFTFTSWDFLQFLGEDYELDLVESELSRISASSELLTHFKEGYSSYFIWESTGCFPSEENEPSNRTGL